jgi:hemerythrin superfamily protein
MAKTKKTKSTAKKIIKKSNSKSRINKKVKSKNDVFVILKKDHNKIKSGFKKILTSKKASKTDLEELEFLLMSHMLAEEKYFYPILEDNKKTRPLALESYEEHNLARLIAGELNLLSIKDELWMPKLKILSEIISHHIEEEEKETFPKSKKIMNQKTKEDIAYCILDEKKSSM